MEANQLPFFFSNSIYFPQFVTRFSTAPFLRNMHFRTIVFLAVSCLSFTALAQKKKQFVVNEEASFDRVKFSLSAPSASCFIRPGNIGKTIMVYGNTEPQLLDPIMSTELREGILHAEFKLQGGNRKAENVLAMKMLGNKESESKQNYNIYLSDKKPYDLDLHYGVGSAYLDLSGLAVEKLRIYTGSADVKIGYLTAKANLVEMDSFLVHVDLGSLEIHKINKSRANHILADVGFGSLLLDFSDKSENSCEIFASVGAGKLEVIMPFTESPILIKLKSSPLCSVTLPSNFKQISKNLYANQYYKGNDENLLNFDVNVAMGSIIFRHKE